MKKDVHSFSRIALVGATDGIDSAFVGDDDSMVDDLDETRSNRMIVGRNFLFTHQSNSDRIEKKKNPK